MANKPKKSVKKPARKSAKPPTKKPAKRGAKQASLKLLGHVTNRAHSGMFVVICDASAQFGGWDEYGELLADNGSMQLELGPVRAFVEEGDGRYGGRVALYRGGDGVLWLAPPVEPGANVLAIDQIETQSRTEVVEMGFVDVPSAKLTVAIAYPPLNKETQGDHAGVTHGKGERLDVLVNVPGFAVSREFTEVGQIIALRPIQAPQG